MSNASLFIYLNEVSNKFNRYLALLIFILGLIGNLLNFFVLSQRSLRSNPCAIYFRTSSLFNLISILFGLTTRILAGWQIDPTSRIDSICKIRTFIVFTSRTIGLWLIVLATIDRWFVSSMKYYHRRRSNTKQNVYRGIVLCSLLSMFFYSHMIYCYEANRDDTPLPCYGRTIHCRLITDLVYCFISIFLPSVLMISFCIMIVVNVHRIHKRARQNIQLKMIRSYRKDSQLLRMLLTQVILLVSFYVPQSIHKLYITLQPSNGDDIQSEHAIKTFIYNVEALLAYIASAIPFYLYTLSGGEIFRRASTQFFQMSFRKMKMFI